MEKVAIADGNAPVELEGGQVIINKQASKKHWRDLSKINQSAGGGVPLHEPKFKNGGDVSEYKVGYANIFTYEIGGL
jgi:hypothetical protein